MIRCNADGSRDASFGVGGTVTVAVGSKNDFGCDVAIDASGKAKGSPLFIFIDTAKFTGHAGELRYEKAKSDTYIYADTNGDKHADLAIHLDDAVKMVKGDFVLWRSAIGPPPARGAGALPSVPSKRGRVRPSPA